MFVHVMHHLETKACLYCLHNVILSHLCVHLCIICSVRMYVHDGHIQVFGNLQIGERVHVDVHNNYQSSDDVHSGDDVHDTVQLPLTDSLVAEESSVSMCTV